MKLFLRTKSTEGKHPLYSKITINGKAVWIDLRMMVDVKEWLEASKSEKKFGNFLVRKGISKKVALIEDAISDMRKHHRLTKEHLDVAIENIVLADKREELKRIEQLGKEIEKKKEANVKNFVIEHIKGIESGEVRTTKKERYTKNACRNWRQFRRVFLDFYGISPFGWDDINEPLVDRFISYLECVGYMKYSIEKFIKMFKTLVGVAERHRVHTNHIATSLLRSPSVSEDDKAKKIYLTKDELNALYEMPLEGFYEQVRDVFLVGCFTGMRFSDYGRLEKANVGYTQNGTKVIRITQAKTSATTVIPIMDDRLDALLEKYDYNMPTLWDQSLNRAIKQICKKLSESVPSLKKKERTILNLKERRAESEAKKRGIALYEYDEQGYPLKARWELVSSHTARRSCITNMYLSKKFSIPQMMSISGHKTEAVFYKYVKLSLDEYAENVASVACDGLF